MRNGLPERLVLPPGAKLIEPADILDRIEKFVGQSEGLASIIVIGKQGDTGNIICRPTGNLPNTKIREMLKVSLAKFDQGDPPDDPHERLIVVPGMRQISQREVVQRIERFVQRCQGMTLILLLCRDGQAHKTRRLQTSNLSAGAARETLRTALRSFNKAHPEGN